LEKILIEAILTIGPQGSGKSSFCKMVREFDPSIGLVSRDQILMQMFGRVYLDSYSGGHHQASICMWEEVEKIVRANSNSRFILDAWSGNARGRRTIIEKLRRLGVDRIVGWYFITDVEKVTEWFWKNPEVARFSDYLSNERRGQNLVFFDDNAPKHDYGLFHRLANDIESEGFDLIIKIDPLVSRVNDVLMEKPAL
jgi:hypothetical protein